MDHKHVDIHFQRIDQSRNSLVQIHNQYKSLHSYKDFQCISEEKSDISFHQFLKDKHRSSLGTNQYTWHDWGRGLLNRIQYQSRISVQSNQEDKNKWIHWLDQYKLLHSNKDWMSIRWCLIHKTLQWIQPDNYIRIHCQDQHKSEFQSENKDCLHSHPLVSHTSTQRILVDTDT